MRASRAGVATIGAGTGADIHAGFGASIAGADAGIPGAGFADPAACTADPTACTPDPTACTADAPAGATGMAATIAAEVVWGPYCAMAGSTGRGIRPPPACDGSGYCPLVRCVGTAGRGGYGVRERSGVPGCAGAAGGISGRPAGVVGRACRPVTQAPVDAAGREGAACRPERVAERGNEVVTLPSSGVCAAPFRPLCGHRQS
ncbi:hypothetical protein GCM10010472_14610 [Pseudonocardia halophobica]|uniref:Uncharacterized protein n=1 Tax=Pseudonocardia halophobica TaxID=29401 RepID=A0A9W6L4E2_9PSEU|nr:hypothetical protein GCM10017577_39700 [Pseudonocardia halophobica]